MTARTALPPPLLTRGRTPPRGPPPAGTSFSRMSCASGNYELDFSNLQCKLPKLHTHIAVYSIEGLNIGALSKCLLWCSLFVFGETTVWSSVVSNDVVSLKNNVNPEEPKWTARVFASFYRVILSSLFWAPLLSPLLWTDSYFNIWANKEDQTGLI